MRWQWLTVVGYAAIAGLTVYAALSALVAVFNPLHL